MSGLFNRGTLAPLESKERYAVLDLLRGVELFGIGFSIIIANAAQNGNSGLRVFYRRMIILFIIGLGLIHVLLIATSVYIIEIIFSNFWPRHCRFGPLEWVWRMLTYGKWLKLIK